MKILLINRWSQLETVGGAERVFFSMANALSERHEVTALAMTQTGAERPFFDLNKNVKFLHLKNCYEKTKSIKHKIARTFYINRMRRHRSDQRYEDPIWARIMEPVIRQEKPDIIIAYSLDIARSCLIDLNVSCPVIIMFHRSAELILDCLTPESKKTLEDAACVQVLMPSDISAVGKAAACKKLVCIPNAVRATGMTSVLQNRVIMHVGRFSKSHKRQHILIEAFHLLQKDFPDWKIEFWGGTSNRIHTRVNAMNWCRNIIWKNACNSRARRMRSRKSWHRGRYLRSRVAKKGWGLRWWRPWKSVSLPLVFAPAMRSMKSFRMAGTASCARTALLPLRRL